MKTLFDGPKFSGDPASRLKDPPTSRAAAQTAASGIRVKEAVAMIMQDGIARIDEEIVQAGELRGMPFGESSYRRGRKSLVRDGYLRATTRPRKTRHGRDADEWVKA